RSSATWRCRTSSEGRKRRRTRCRIGHVESSGRKKARLKRRAESISEETWRRQFQLYPSRCRAATFPHGK
ncbi:hypothetical protein EON00_34990, partial [Burkholderia sp. ISTR5]|nr:hypothetical protein [Burkholderia sp. ISTR5]